MELVWLILSNFFPDINGDILPLVREPVHQDWFFIMVSGILVLLAFVRAMAPRRFLMILQAPLSLRKTVWLRDEGNVFFHATTITLFVVSITVAALYVQSLSVFVKSPVPFLNGSPFLVMAKLMGGLAALWLLKDLMIFITGRIFKAPASSFLNMLNKYVLNVTTSLLVFLFVILNFYLEDSFYVYVPVYLIILVYIYRLIRTFMIGRKVGNFLSFYIILYLCALEMLPVLLLFLVVERFLEQLA